MWKIEKIVKKGDYDYGVCKAHPNCTEYGYVLHHRLIMENHIGRLLTSDEVVHHKDGNKKNNDISNLELMDGVEHSRLHSQTGRKMVNLKCPNCGELFIREKRNSFLQKGSRYTCCSRHCRSVFARNIQLNRLTTLEVETAITGNLVSEFNSHDNPVVTDNNQAS